MTKATPACDSSQAGVVVRGGYLASVASNWLWYNLA